MFGDVSSGNAVRQMHPSYDHVLLLWQIFLQNVNPMTKLVHQPTLQEIITRASLDMDHLSKGLEALMFSIYTAAVTSMESDDCEIKLGESREVLLMRYRHATRKALARAGFMATSDIQVLQALTLYLLVMRADFDSRTTWTFAGVANRVAQGMGLHRDGLSLGVSPFETEMRRRLWWQISNLDFRAAELSGTGRLRDFTLSDTQPPTNIDDVDIHPDMTEHPTVRPKATEMIAFLLRCECNCFWKEKVVEKANATFENIRLLLPYVVPFEERIARVDELEQRFEERYLRYCDPTIPAQFISILIGRATIDSLRLMAYCGAKLTKPANTTLSQEEYLWDLCIKLIESDNLAHSTKALRRFIWHTNVYFPWQALFYLFYELKTNTLGDKVDNAWELLDELFSHHTNFIQDNRKPLHVAIGSLCVKAYDAREATLREKTNGVFPKSIPEYIVILRDQQKRAKVKFKKSGNLPSEAVTKDTQSTLIKTSQGSVHPRSTTTKNTSQQQPEDQHIPTNPSHLPFQVAEPNPNITSDQFMFASDPELAQDLAMAGMPMDWTQWDFAMQDFEQALEI